MRLDLIHAGTADLLRGLWRREILPWPGDGELTAKRFLDDLDAQGMSPLVWHQLNKHTLAMDWPAEVVEGLRDRAFREAAAELVWDAELQSVLKSLAAEGISPLLFKGSALSRMCYPQPGLRPRCDTDLLVPESMKQLAQSVMRKRGYQPLYEASVEQISGQMNWFKPGRTRVGHSYDLHWRIRNNDCEFVRVFNYDYLLDGAVMLEGLGEHARALNPADALLLACVHRAGHFSHSGDRLVWLHDIHLLAAALTAEDIERFQSNAEKLGLHALCADAFGVTASWFGTVFPPPLDVLRRSGRKGREGQAYLQLDRASGIRRSVRRELKAMTWSEGLRFLIQNLFPPPAYMYWRYGTDDKLRLPGLYIKRLLQGMRIVIGK
ncbi:nucleotidyltransferase domain-containing protein [Thiolapillus brandeum]|uniref:Nucleotidyltransferase family protein n=1 Tax=Thiolapillus brandeum TaxID=1076588 RepID=A0A7U6GHF8_9GAMM|nr:nucleotidyltransferase family protein [Thiolapillus brandeum]BAO43695.1 hypothetical protein TBH_C0758 [Thiolapillus brandeum]